MIEGIVYPLIVAAIVAATGWGRKSISRRRRTRSEPEQASPRPQVFVLHEPISDPLVMRPDLLPGARLPSTIQPSTGPMHPGYETRPARHLGLETR